jgi:hypothetical protein
MGAKPRYQRPLQKPWRFLGHHRGTRQYDVYCVSEDQGILLALKHGDGPSDVDIYPWQALVARAIDYEEALARLKVNLPNCRKWQATA